jgi:hypothetical protein
MGESDREIFLRKEMEDAESKQTYWIGTRRHRKRRPEGRTLLRIIGKEMEKQSGQPSVPNKCRYFIYASSLKNVNVWEVGLLAQVTTRSAWAN